MRLLFSLIIALTFLHGAPALAAETAGFQTGFIEKDIWFSEEKPTEGDAIKIYTAVFNGRSEMLSGTIAFYDAGTILGKKAFSVSGKSVATVSIDWNVTAGSHAIYAEIITPTILVAGKEQAVFLENSKSDDTKLTVAKKIILSSEAATEDSDATPNAAATFITKHLPEAVAVPVLATTTAVDEWRAETGVALVEKQSAFEAKIEAAKDAPAVEVKGSVGVDEEGKPTLQADSFKVDKPLDHVKLFFIKIVAYIFSHKTLFYVTVGLVLLLLLRFAWKRLF